MEEADSKQSMRPRLVVDITRDVQDRLQEHIPWGLQSTIFRTMIDGLLSVLEKGGPGQRDLVIAAFLSRDITVLDLLRRVMQDELK